MAWLRYLSARLVGGGMRSTPARRTRAAGVRGNRGGRGARRRRAATEGLVEEGALGLQARQRRLHICELCREGGLLGRHQLLLHGDLASHLGEGALQAGDRDRNDAVRRQEG